MHNLVFLVDQGVTFPHSPIHSPEILPLKLANYLQCAVDDPRNLTEFLFFSALWDEYIRGTFSKRFILSYVIFKIGLIYLRLMQLTAL